MKMRKQALAFLALLAALTLLLSGCTTPQALSVSRKGITKTAPLQENEPIPMADYQMSKEDVLRICCSGGNEVGSVWQTLRGDQRSFGFSVLRKSPGYLYYTILDTQLGGRLYLFYIGLTDDRQALKLENWSSPKNMRRLTAFYVERRLSYADFSELSIGMTRENVVKLFPELLYNENRLETSYLLSDGVIRITYNNFPTTPTAHIETIEYYENFQPPLLTNYSATLPYSVPLSYRIWDVDYPAA